jgi:GcrA cell cycle regulator
MDDQSITEMVFRNHQHRTATLFTANWDADQIEVVRTEWPKNELSAAQIGAKIGKSRNAVIGKANRLGLVRPKPVRDPNRRIRPTRAKNHTGDPMKKDKVKQPYTPKIETGFTGQPISIMELTEGRCKAPAGHGSDGLMTYCGDFTFDGKSFCEGHCALFYVPKDQYRKRGYR